VGPSSLVLGKRKPDVDPIHEPMHIQHLWVLLPGLPLEFYNDKALVYIENQIGNLIVLEENF
jgi:hypothetical protein